MSKKVTVPLWARNNTTPRVLVKPAKPIPLWMRGNNERLQQQEPQDPVSAALAAYRKPRVRPPVIRQPELAGPLVEQVIHRLTSDRPEHWPARPSPAEFEAAGYKPEDYEAEMAKWEDGLRKSDDVLQKIDEANANTDEIVDTVEDS